MAWTVKIVDRDGTVIRTLAKANVKSVIDELGLGEATFTYPKIDPAGASGQASDVMLLAREVQIYQDATLEFWGILLGRGSSSASSEMTVTCLGLGWYVTRLFVDKTRTNYLTNPDFESGLTGWTAVGCTATVITSPRRLGAQAVRLVGTVTGGDAYIHQTFSITGTEIGTNVFAVAYMNLEAYTGGALEDRLLYMEATEGGIFQANAFATFADADPAVYPDDPPGAFARLKTGLNVPAGHTWDIDVRLMAIDGTLVWDAAQAVIPESVGAYDADIATLAQIIIEHIQDPSAGKVDLNIGTDTPATGVTVPSRWYQFAAHTPATTALEELTERSDGIDWWIETTPTTRTFTTAVRRGSDLSGSVTFSFPGNIATYELAEDAGAVESDVVIYDGDEDGPDREEGHAVDTTYTGGLILEGRDPAPPDTPVDGLLPLAEGRLGANKKVARHITATLKNAATLSTLVHAGDVVDRVVDDGDANQLSGNWRITRRELRPRGNVLIVNLTEE